MASVSTSLCSACAFEPPRFLQIVPAPSAKLAVPGLTGTAPPRRGRAGHGGSPRDAARTAGAPTSSAHHPGSATRTE